MTEHFLITHSVLMYVLYDWHTESPIRLKKKNNHAIVATEILGSSVQERHAVHGAGPAESYKTDQGIGASSL